MNIAAALWWAVLVLFIAQQPAEKPEWCRKLPRPEYSKLERVSIADPWFEVYRIRPGVFAIYEPHQSEEVISYLILGDKKALLFDTGMGISNIRKVVEGLTPLPVSVVNSHTHNDHVGDNWRFRDVYGMDTDFTRENARGSKADAQAELAPGEICGDLPPGFDPKTYVTRPFNITHWLRGGEKIDLGGRVIEVISTPGHTPDSISLWDAANGLLFTGDMYYAGPIYLFRPETNLDAYEASIQKMASLPAKLLLPAHNVPVGDPAVLPRVLAAMKELRAGKIKPVKNGARWEYKFQGFSFLMKQQLAISH
jgi:glyoxylase-like metal-dependent hydrolase (beta-lactamase superfamily II)